MKTQPGGEARGSQEEGGKALGQDGTGGGVRSAGAGLLGLVEYSSDSSDSSDAGSND